MGTAVISDDGKYRYLLHRNLEELVPEHDRKHLFFIMLNPSTADANNDDPTIRRCINFGKAWGYTDLYVVNLYALRATNPKELWKTDDPVGPENDKMLKSMMSAENCFVCAWGANAKPDRVAEVMAIADKQKRILHCLGTTKSGQPKHPLYIKADQPLVEFKPPA